MRITYRLMPTPKWIWGLVLFFVAICIGIIGGGLVPFDQWLSHRIAVEETGALYQLFTYITELGSATGITILTAIFSIILYRKRRKFLPALFIIGTVLSTYGLNVVIKDIVERQRPMINALIDAHGYSFPSGHSMISIVAYGLFVYLLCKWDRKKSHQVVYGIIGALIVLLIGYSRIVLSAHYVFDVLAGFSLGAGILIGAIYIFEHYFDKKAW
ncbi:MAG: phosphatase PAP2 family protein [Bacillaceae bacterium]